MRAIRVGLNRYLKKDNINFSMIFKPVNDARNAYLVEFAREG